MNRLLRRTAALDTDQANAVGHDKSTGPTPLPNRWRRGQAASVLATGPKDRCPTHDECRPAPCEPAPCPR